MTGRRYTALAALACALFAAACSGGDAGSGDATDAADTALDTSSGDTGDTSEQDTAPEPDAGVDTTPDPDTGGDTGEDTEPDTASDADAGNDTEPDADAGEDTAPDVPDTGGDTTHDVRPDTPDTGIDTSADVRPDAPDTGGDTTHDVPDADTGTDAATDTGADTTPDAGPNQPPTVFFTTPLPDAAVPRTGMQRFIVSTADPDDGASTLSVAFTHEGGLPLADPTYSGDGFWTLDIDPLPRGPHTLAAVVTDPGGLSGSASIDFVSNSPPGRPGVRFNPAAITARNSVAVVVTPADDPDRDPVTTSLRWTLDDVPQPELDDLLEVPADRMTRDSVWGVTAQHSDGLSLGEPRTESITVDNAAPIVSDVTLTPLDDAWTTWRCDAIVDDPDRGVTTEQQWFLADAPVATGAEYTLPSPVAADTELRCVVTATDDRDATDTSEASVTVGNAPPVITRVEITTDGDGVMFETYSCEVDAFDPDGGDVSITYSWFSLRPDDPTREREFGTEQTDLLDLRDFVAPGDTFFCRATVTDDIGDSTSSTASFVLGNLPPYVVVEASTSPEAEVRTGREVRCSFTADDDDQFDLTRTYEWFVGDTLVGAGTTITPNGVDVVRGDTLTCTATATDPSGASVSSSTSLAVINGLPEVVSIAVREPLYDVSPTAECLVEVVDPDGDDVTIEYSWAYAPGGIGTSLPWDTRIVDGPFEGGTRYNCGALPSDPFEDGRLVASDRVRAEINVAPMVSIITLEPSEPGTTDTIVATWEIDDPNEAQEISVDIDWQVGGVTVATEGTTLDPALSDIGDTITLSLTPSDEFVTGETASASVTVGNTRPTIATVELLPVPAVRGRDDLQCVVGAVSDADGDDVTVSVAWDWRRSISFGTYSDIDTTPLTTTLDGDTISSEAPAGLYRCTVTAEDERAGTRQVAVEASLVGNPFTLRGPGDGYGEQILVGSVDSDALDDLLLPSPDNEVRQAQLVLGEQVSLLQNSGFTGRAFAGVEGFDIADELAFEFADVDGDERDDIIVAAVFPWDDDDEALWPGGGVWVFAASSYPDDGSMLTPEMADAFLAAPVEREVLPRIGSFGDLDGDGSDDLYVVARDADGRVNPLTDIYLLTRSAFASDTLDDATWRIGPSIESDVVRLGDIDGDTQLDLVVDQGGATWVLPASELPAPGPVTFRGPGWAIITEIPEGTTAQIAGDFDGDGVDDMLVHTPGAERDRDRVAIVSGTSFQDGGAGYDGARIALLPPIGTYELDATWAPVVTGIGDLDDDGSDDVFVRYHRAYELYEGLGDTNYALGCVVFGGSFADTPAGTCFAYGGVDVRSGGTATVAEIDGDGVPDLYAVNAFYTSSASSTVNGPMYGFIQPEGFAVCTPTEIPSVVDMIEDKAVAYDILPCVCGAGESCWRECEDFIATEYVLTEGCAEASRQLLECAVDEVCNRDCRGDDPDACRACIVDECRAWAFITGYDAAVR